MSAMFEDKNKVYDCIENAIKSDDNFIYLKKSIEPVEVFPFDKLHGVICDIGDDFLVDSGIPNELINSIDMSIYTPDAFYKDNESIAYFSPNGYDTKEHVLSLIKLFNMLSSINITIYTTHDIHFYVKTFSNSNITFSRYKDPKEVTISTSIIITYGYCARRFVQQKIPTIIIGSYGFGGWVTPENFGYLIRENFKGRPGGMFNEMIPLEILVDEFMEIKECNDIDNLLNRNFELLETYLNYTLSHEIEASINYFTNIHTRYTDFSQRSFLKPRLASNVEIRRNGNTTFIQRKVINDILFSLPESDLQFLKDLNSGLTCENLQDNYELNSEEFWEIMIPLWERKAIIFYYDVS